MTKMRILLFLIFSGLLQSSIFAQESSWDLPRCIQQAMEENLDLISSEFAIRNSEISYDLAKQARYPSLNANSNVSWNFGRTIDPTSNEFITKTFFSNNYGLNTGMILFDGFRLKKNIERSEMDVRASKADLDQARDDISLSVCLAYLNVLFAKENIKVSDSQYALNEQQIARVRKLINAGASPAGDILSLEAQLAQSEQANIQAENGLETAILQLEQLLRIDASGETEFLIPEDIVLTTDPELVTFEEVYQFAVQNRHDLRAAKLREEIAHKDIGIQESGKYPTITVGGNLSTNYSNQALDQVGSNTRLLTQEFFLDGIPVSLSREVDEPILEQPGFTNQLENFLSYGFGFGINIPIYNNGTVKGGIARAKINKEAQHVARLRVEDRLKNNILTAIADARAAKKKMAASEKSVSAQELAVNNISKQLEVGSANSFDWQNAKTQLENAEINLLIDKYDYIFKVKVLEFYQGKPLKI